MYRITSHVFTSKTLLYCRPATVLQVKTISRCTTIYKYKNPTERETCPKPLPPPPPPAKDDKLFWGSLAMLMIAGGFAYYAKQSPELRDWLTLHAPWFDDLIAVASQENLTYREFAEETIECMKKCINNYFNDTKPKECSLEGGDVPPVQAIGPDEKPEGFKDEEDGGDEKPPCVVLPPPVVTKNICEVEDCLRDLGETIVINYISAKDACAYYNKLVQDTMVDFSMEKLKEIHEAMAERENILKESKGNICSASRKLDELSRYLDCGVQAPKEHINTVKGMIADFHDKISAARMKYLWENDMTVALDSHVLKVEELVTQYTEENQTLYSGLKYDSKKPVLNGCPDLLLYHSFRYSNRLQQELSDASSGMTERINRALESLPQNENDLKNRNNIIQSEYKKKKADMNKEFKKRYDDLRANNDKILKESLKKQLERHEENLQHKLLHKENETQGKLDKMVAEQVAQEKRMFALQLMDMANKLKNVEDKLNARLKAERETRRSQELYAAGSSLLAATKKGDPVVRVDKELKAIEKASGNLGDGDKLVLTVLKAIPDSVRTTGLVPESVLRERYHRMEKAALRVALVEQEGGPMPVFILSWLQSLMLFMKLSCIPQAEYDKPPAEPAKDLDTFDLLRRARFWVERGNLAAAIRYVSALQGASKSAASTWFDAARSHLETRQAAEAVLAHAAALGLQYI